MFSRSVILSFNKHSLSTCCVPGPVLGAGDPAENKADQPADHLALTLSLGRHSAHKKSLKGRCRIDGGWRAAEQPLTVDGSCRPLSHLMPGSASQLPAGQDGPGIRGVQLALSVGPSQIHRHLCSLCSLTSKY